ncbi:ORF43 protein [Operophtera brumata nucleopolyhedrovirus]|uniref:ORF43 protein n=1 Tax=Operophtera brumata nucleopolyhedrovirus TaxID=1046267 RepID=A0A2H4UZQ0_9ABAC|nr:ORF43 protein [Operophtera brumata nucleopolyhedrovirus]AUA60274.1 ORF43 protein [Operophtera brumata nucleopolyhedrovirus]
MDEQLSRRRSDDDEPSANKRRRDDAPPPNKINPVEVYNVNRNENDLSFPGDRLLVLEKDQYNNFIRYEPRPSDDTYIDLYTQKTYTKKELTERGIIKPYTKLRTQLNQLCIIVY